MKPRSVKTTCPYCGVGCGLVAKCVSHPNQASSSGDFSHPANMGALCVKGSSLDESHTGPARLLYPQVNGKQASWQEAIDTIAQRFYDIKQQHGSDALSMYVSGQLLTEDYYVANKLMKGFVGSANIDTNSRLCMSSAVASHVRAFGEDVVPVNYQDIELAEMIVLVGSNAAWTHPIVFRRIQQARESNPNLKLVVIDPRKTMTAEQADLHLPLSSDSDVALFMGLARYCDDTKQLDTDYINQHTQGADALMKALKLASCSLDAVSEQTQVDKTRLKQFYHWFATKQRVITLYCQGVNQAANGTDKGNAIINAHLLTGKIGREGCGPFSITGQPNAMGGREVGGLANQLAAHRGFDPQSIEQVQAIWQAPNMATKPGLKAVDLFDAIEQGEVKAVWIMATNPVVSLPQSQKIKRALKRCELVIVSDICVNSDIAQYADILLPAAGWGEKQGMVTNSERMMSRQRAFLPMRGESKPDWWAISKVGQAFCSLMEVADGFDYQSEYDIFKEHIALSSINKSGPYIFELSELSTLSEEEYNNWQPTQWPLNGARPFADGSFSTSSGRANLIVPEAIEQCLPRGHQEFILNTGRDRDQWHTMTRTGYVSSLTQKEVEPTLYLNPLSIERAELATNQLAQVTLPDSGNSIVVRIKADEGLGMHSVYLSMHWAGEFGAGSGVNQVTESVVDPISGQPAFKSTLVSVRPFKIGSYMVAMGEGSDKLRDRTEFASMQVTNTGGFEGRLWRYASQSPLNKQAWNKAIGVELKGKLLVLDTEHGWVTLSCADGAELTVKSVIQVENKTFDADVEQLSQLIGQPFSLSKTLKAIQTGVTSKLVCSCYRVTENQIIDAIQTQSYTCIAQLQSELKCGSNCGSCLPEVEKIANQHFQHSQHIDVIAK
ncbi:molybdopterin-dependent oxidoreductase [Vibrio sp. ZSDZ34]|uniref:Molybdopterin-dependent oxidoreductase n=1 Tax=Vibrio gelatinilyticus TaxID=2893468 RepID=A0A9X2AYX7_9VIBR|nr:molybdopterin-dependent oxidoreductase [Vibrio gelatinilyticus]MCJ2377217.1 molybdopterin-dependent oxidoreductase [Vibrio gelatinilyticus]